VKPFSGGYDLLAVRQRWRHRRVAKAKARIREVFEQKVLDIRPGVPNGVEAAQHRELRHRPGDAGTKSDLLSPRIPLRVGALGQAGLQYE